jgi:ribA/ribD-fused uncharacterized protein
MALPTRRYYRFYGFETPLSNTRFSRFTIDEVAYNSVEQYFNHQKAKYFGDEVAANKIMEAQTPMDAFRSGRVITLPEMSPEENAKWVKAAKDLMEKGLREKVWLYALFSFKSDFFFQIFLYIIIYVRGNFVLFSVLY